MPKLSQNRKLNKRKNDLVQALEYTKKLRHTIEEYQNKIDQNYKEGKINYLQYKEAQKRVFQGRSATDWIQYYDQCISYYQKELSFENGLYKDEQRKPKHVIMAILAVIFISLLGFGAYTGYDTAIETINEESVEEAENDLVQEEVIEEEIGSESNESAANIPEEIITSAGIMPVEEIIESNVSNEVVNNDEVNNLSEEIIIDIDEEVVSENISGENRNFSGEVIIDEEVIAENISNNDEEIINENIFENESTNFIENITEIPEVNYTNNYENISKPSKEQIDNLTKQILRIENTTIENETLESTNVNIIHEEIKQFSAEIGKPVRWNKKIILQNESALVSVDLPKNAELVSVYKISEEDEIEIDLSDIKVNNSGELVDIINTDIISQEPVALSAFGGIFSWLSEKLVSLGRITGFATIEEETIIENNISIVIEEAAKEVVVEYYTEAPQVYEEYTNNGKLITISSDTHYENILSYTELADVEEESIQFYWIVNGTRQKFDYTAYDLNNNSLIDYIQWITPHLSNETFQIDLLIINVQSYPVVGGNWSVSFNTTGNANLTVSAANGTRWSNSSLDRDLKFIDIICNDQVLDYQWINDSAFIENYSCSSTAVETSKVVTPGVHTLEFIFGNITRYAYNDASYANCPSADGNVTVSTNTVWANASFDCNYIEIINNAVLTLNSTGAGNTTINITANNFNITTGAEVSVSNTGFLRNQGPGAGKGNSDAGAAHGGQGGNTFGVNPPSGGSAYGSITEPLTMGSGGDTALLVRGRGAGAVYLNISGTLTVDGIINASAIVSSEGGGSGGSIYINASTIQGIGLITANGGAVTDNSDGAGAGGRIAVYYVTNNFIGHINATSGGGAAGSAIGAGGAGTIYLKSSSQTNGELIIDNRNIIKAKQTYINSSFLNKVTLDSLTVANASIVILDNIDNLTINNTLFDVNNGTSFTPNVLFRAPRISNFTIGGEIILSRYTFNDSMDVVITGTGNLLHRNNSNIQEFSLNITARNFTILQGGYINIGDKGYPNISGPGAPPQTSNDAGAGYGGQGGSGSGTAGGSEYGSITLPNNLGSGGHASDTNYGKGGGLLVLNITDTLVVNGSINGSAPASVEGGGAGAGIFINTTSFKGVGTITADGGKTTTSSDGGGAGGRIAIYYGNNTFAGSINASGGNVTAGVEKQAGGAGTIFKKAYNQSFGELIISNQEFIYSTQTNINSSFLSITYLDNLTIANKSDVVLQNIDGLTINNTVFDINTQTEFYIYANFSAPRMQNMTINGTLVFGGNYTFNESMTVTLLSGANVSHRNNSNSSTSGIPAYSINITMRNLTIYSGAVVDVSSKGYQTSGGPGGVVISGSADPGASYGGIGGSNGVQKGRTYGNMTTPLEVGSGGDGSPGAGAIFLNITDTLIVNGSLNASSPARASAGGGSGGSIYIITKILSGVGSILAKGGDSNAATDGAGGGGRIALYYQTNTFSGEMNVSGGNSSAVNHGLAGSLFICKSTATVNCTGIGGSSVLLRTGNITLVTEYTINTSVIINKTVNVSWSRVSVNWTDASNNITNTVAIHNVSGLSENSNYSIYENSTLKSTQISNGSGALNFFNFSLNSQQHDINVANTSGGSVPTSVGISIDDGAIAFGSGYYNASCTQGYASINSNTSSSCWINTTTFMSTEDVHLISNNGTASANVSASLQIQDAETFFCGSLGGCGFTTSALISIGAADNEASSCTGLSGFNNLATDTTNRTASLCNSLGFAAASNQIKTWVLFQAPKDSTSGAKTLTIVYEAIAA